MNSPATSDQLEKKRNHQIWWQLAILVVVSAVAVYVGSAFDDQIQNYLPEQRILSSTYNKKPSGLSGLSEVLKQVGLNTHPWLLPYRNLRTAHGTLVIIAPLTSPAESEAEQILAWVEAGNDLIYLDHFSFKMTRRLLEKLHLSAEDSEELHDKKVPVDETKPLFAHVPKLTISADTVLTGGKPLVSIDNKPIFSELKYGKGRILVGTAPTLCANRRLAEKNNWANFQFLVNWLGTAHGEIMFDERCHGFSQSGNVFIVLAKTPWGAVFLQTLLILTVAIYSASKRFGATKVVIDERKISNLEFIIGLSNAYQRAKANGAIFGITGQSLRNRICKLVSVSPHEPTSKILEAWKQWIPANSTAFGDLTDEVPKFLQEFDQLHEQNNISDAQFKSMMIECDKINQRFDELTTSSSLTRLNG